MHFPASAHQRPLPHWTPIDSRRDVLPPDGWLSERNLRGWQAVKCLWSAMCLWTFWRGPSNDCQYGNTHTHTHTHTHIRAPPVLEFTHYQLLAKTYFLWTYLPTSAFHCVESVYIPRGKDILSNNFDFSLCRKCVYPQGQGHTHQQVLISIFRICIPRGKDTFSPKPIMAASGGWVNLPM